MSVGQSGRGDDRCTVLVFPDRLILAVADGAGGTGGGAHAAETVLRLMHERSERGSFDALELLRACDLALASDPTGGETTAVIAVIDEAGVVGASVGDSGAWLVEPSRHVELTRHQTRKPLIGSGRAIPIAFGCGPLSATLLLGSDGLLKYGNAARIRQLATGEDLAAIPAQLIASVKLPSGELQDDTAVVIVRSVRTQS